MNQKYLSIIIPVYNVAPYLRECLDSVFSQSAPSDRYEVICVDDGSSDESGEILSAYKEQHGNFTVIRQNNAGVSAARNRGMDAAQGEYLWFVDGDDFIGTDCISGILDDLRREALESACPLPEQPVPVGHGDLPEPLAAQLRLVLPDDRAPCANESRRV